MMLVLDKLENNFEEGKPKRVYYREIRNKYLLRDGLLLQNKVNIIVESRHRERTETRRNKGGLLCLFSREYVLVSIVILLTPPGKLLC